ncbi:MAG: penicillin-binding protein 2 [Patescibacteria group bacterium]
MKLLKVGHLGRWLISLHSPLRSSDLGIFDPYLPIDRLKRPLNELADTEEITGEADFATVPPGGQFNSMKIIVLLASAALAIRLIGLQITSADENSRLAEGNRLTSRPVLAARGLIVDRHGQQLVRNEPDFTLLVEPAELPSTDQLDQDLWTLLTEASGLPQHELKDIIRNNRANQQVVLKEGIGRDQAITMELKLNRFPGVKLLKTPNRHYAELPGLGHLVGYVGKASPQELANNPNLSPPAMIGKTGLEKTYDRYLRGQPGRESLESDSLGRTVRTIGNQPAKAGSTLILSLDSNLQRTAARALEESVSKSGAASAAAVVIDVNTGQVVSMVSFPFFDNNLFNPSGDRAGRQSILTDPRSPLLNRAIAGQYPAGSTIKPIVAAAGLQEKTINRQTKLDTSEGKITVGQTTFHDWKTHGTTDVLGALAESNNIFFMAVGGSYKNITGLGAGRLASYLKKFGFGATTGLDLTSEEEGLVPDPEWKKRTQKEDWFTGDTYNLSIGQGDLLITPLQLTRAIAAIANNGQLLTPHLVKEIHGPGQTPRTPIESRPTGKLPINPANLALVRQGMRQAVETGSARSLNSLPIEVAAKTGTAQFNLQKDKTHSWFTAFAPYNNPQIALAVIVEGGGEGFAVAAPVARNILEQYFNLPLTPITPPAPQAETD